jgi:chromosome segregation ATPase
MEGDETMDAIEEIKARLRREDEEKERAWQKRLKEIDEEQAQWRAENEKRERAEQEKRERLRRERQREHARAEEHRTKELARASWVDAGGTEEDFDKAWPEMWRQTLVARALEGESQARLASQQRIIETF